MLCVHVFYFANVFLLHGVSMNLLSSCASRAVSACEGQLLGAAAFACHTPC
jgi:hypothetical protein